MRDPELPAGSPYPAILCDLTWDMFALVRCWDPEPLCGPDRGRAFEKIFCWYCDRRGLSLSEAPGSRTLLYQPSASGYSHENDAVIARPGFTVHLELKYLSADVDKSALMIFNQKGLDFLFADNPTLRRRPLYRVLLSGSSLSFEARVFAAQWGILTVEPGRIPLIGLLALAARRFPGLPTSVQFVAEKIIAEVPFFVAPLQARLNRVATALEHNLQLVESARVRRMLIDFQEGIGDYYWRMMDRLEPSWIEDRYDGVVTGAPVHLFGRAEEYNALVHQPH